MVKTKKQRRRFESRLRIERKMWGMSQQELADRVGCARLTIVNIEHQRYCPSLLLAYDIAEVFGLPISEIFSFSTILEDMTDIDCEEQSILNE